MGHLALGTTLAGYALGTSRILVLKLTVPKLYPLEISVLTATYLMVVYFNLVKKPCSASGHDILENISTICTSIFVVYHVLILIIWLLVIDSLAEAFVAQADALDIYTENRKFTQG